MHDPITASASARAGVQGLRSSKIRDVANAGMGRSGVIPFWFGEPDEGTPEYITRAAVEALEKGDTFYVQTHGLPALREAIARYLQGLHGRPIDVARIAVTSSGTSGLMLALQAVVEFGDRVVAITPLWPNLVEMPKLLGASVKTVGLRFDGRWRLDLEQLFSALTPGTRALLVNAPNNPTGWTLSVTEQRAILAHCRARGIWIIADDVYERLYFKGTVAPSFLDIAEIEDRLISSNSFSKAWRMTGWRLGWVVVPKQLHADLGKLIEFNTTCSPPFIQRAAVAALEQGEADIDRTIKRLAASGAHLVQGLSRIPRVVAPPLPQGAMYLFFQVAGIDDSLQFCRSLALEAGLGLAPGIAFGPDGEGYLRWCFASGKDRIDEGLNRLTTYLR